jgi:hypothetical protein
MAVFAPHVPTNMKNSCLRDFLSAVRDMFIDKQLDILLTHFYLRVRDE